MGDGPVSGPQVIADAIETLESTGCVFWACEGPDVPFEGMKTCKVCSTIQDLREAVAAGVFRDEATVKAEALEEAAGDASMCDVGLPSPDAHEKATEWLLARANRVRAGSS